MPEGLGQAVQLLPNSVIYGEHQLGSGLGAGVWVAELSHMGSACLVTDPQPNF